jgi:hypothetical protein
MPKPFHTICSKCGKDKQLFSLLVNGVERVRSRCMPCHAARSYASRLRKKDEHVGKARQRLVDSLERRAYVIWKRAKDRAKKRSLVFELTKDFVAAQLSLGYCSATNLKFDLSFDETKLNPRSPSLDRIDPTLGYTFQNTRMVCWIFNRAKGDGSDKDVRMLVEAFNAINIRKTA